MTPPNGMFIDHINRNKLDNRRSNLRIVTTSQNVVNCPPRKNNTSGYRGVSKKGNMWIAQIEKGDKKIFQESYTTPEQAAKAYDRKIKEVFGEFAYLNFPENAE